MTARPIRRNAQTPDRNGKIFYTSTTSLSHISKISGHEAVYGEIDVIKSERKSTIQTEPVVRSRNIVETQGFCYNGGEHLTIEKEAGAYAHQLPAAMGHPKRARHEERGLAACRRSDFKYDCQYGKGRAYQHENAAAYLRDAELRYCRCDCFGAGRKPHGHRASLVCSQ